MKLYKRYLVLFFSKMHLIFVKLAQEIESQAISAQREINIVKTTISSKQRDVRMLELTSSEVKQLSENTKIYEGVGKMWVFLALAMANPKDLIYRSLHDADRISQWCYRFVFSPTAVVEKRLLSETMELKNDISNLNKKLHYLETTHKNSQDHIDKIFNSGGRS